MAAARVLEHEDQRNFMIEENNRIGTYQESLPAGVQDLGRIYVEARVNDDFEGDLEQVGHMLCERYLFH